MTASDTTTNSPFDRPPSPPAAARPVRPFLWSVRRELWENHAIWIAPLAVAGVVILGGLFAASGIHGGKTVHRTVAVASQTAAGAATAGVETRFTQSSPGGEIQVQKIVKTPSPAMTPQQRQAMVMIPFYMVGLALLVTMFLVGTFYCLGGLYNERRDRSILFWKSLPVNDLTTVLSKVTVPMVILPAVTLVVTAVTQATLLLIGMAGFAKTGDADISVPLGEVMVVGAYGLITTTLWWAPLYAWFLMVSGWAKRAPFLWAVLPPLGLAVAEKIAMNTTAIGGLIQSRLMGDFAAAFVTPQGGRPNTMPRLGIEQIDAAKFISSPGLWLGLLAAAAMIAVAVWMRRRGEPI
ncbi:MAG: hypothetical protein ACXWKO_03345 [Phenylobacterium sp.]